MAKAVKVGTQSLAELYSLDWFRNRVKSKKGPHVSSQHLADLVYGVFTPRRVIDLGCGTLAFANRISELGAKAVGVDGSEFNREFAAKGVRYMAHDLSKPWVVGMTKFDLLTSWDVFEHVPRTSEHVLTDTVNQLASKWAVLSIDASSWGRGHINCRPKGYWRTLFGEAGLTFEPGLTAEVKRAILADEKITSKWYGNNLSIFSVASKKQ